HHAAAVAGAAGIVVADLGGGRDVAEVLDGPGPQQHLPVVAPGVQHERGRDQQQARAVGGQAPVQLGEPQVVADRQPDPYPVDVDGHGRVAGGDGVGLVEGDPSGDLDVVQVDLPVGGDQR